MATDIRQSFGQRQPSETINQQHFPPFGVAYLFILMFSQFLSAGVRVSKILLMTEELQFGEEESLMIIHSRGCFMDMVMCVGIVLTSLYCGPYYSCVLQKFLETAIVFPICIIPTTGYLGMDDRKMIYLFGQLAGVLSSFATASIPYFVADQFNMDNYLIFNRFQVVINHVFAALGIFTAPHIIQYFECLSTKTCYSAVWVADWVITFITLIIYLILFKIIRKRRPKQSVLLMFINLVHDGRKRKKQAKKQGNLRKMPLFDFSKLYTPEFRKDAKKVWSMWSFYFPLAGYWALHSQLMTTWVLQAKALNGAFFDWSNILPNEICGVVPLFGLAIRFVLKKFLKELKYPLRAVVFSQVLMAIAFFLAAILEVLIISKGQKVLHIGWTLPQLLLFSISDAALILSYRKFVIQDIPIKMRGVTQSLFILSRSFGNVIVVLMNFLKLLTGFPNRMAQFIIYAVMLNLFLIIFALMNRKFERVLDDERGSVISTGRLTKIESAAKYQ